MTKGRASLFMASFGTALFLAMPVQVRADFVMKFTDRRQVVGQRYVEEGQVIKIYTPYGTISFRKDDVERVMEVDSSLSIRTPLEVVTTTSMTDVKNSGQITKPEKGKTAGANDTAAAAVERIEGQNQEIEQEFNKLWEKDVQETGCGASEEVLAENRDKLNQLSDERRKLVEEARQVAPDNLPTWAQ